ncbi:alcohol dehydrogenase catalytic domain-containing protein [Gloeobacter violaceus]|uniref:Glr3591 protein n=1 Tax=Gloeobacter violaceus (strain ATCC 29082 / PCC 7421) TaxID=251221 RepID=Q7NFD5_GLOVI|nr:alcohol dehydrogenase catalytic domain-containing protein [Gloeobacter violaceus]BAC91532.1 glr3591 [Gloeobacter violaceus PCC 7421]
MQAAVIESFGGPQVFEYRHLPVPVPKGRELLIRVKATSVNPLDCQIRRGNYKEQVSLPAILGHDVSGVVEAVGDAVRDFAEGDEVFYVPRIFGGPGSYAQYHVVEEAIVAHKPANLSHAQAAALPLAGGTAWDALVVRAALRVGESILIHAGAGGVGSLAVQLARAMGAQKSRVARLSAAAHFSNRQIHEQAYRRSVPGCLGHRNQLAACSASSALATASGSP